MPIPKILCACILAFAASSLHAQEVTFYTPTTVRVVKQAPDTSKDMNLSLVVIAEPEDVKVSVSRKGSVTTYSSSALRVSVDERNGRLTFADKAGKVLLQEGEMAFTPISEGPDAGRYKVKQAFALESDEPIYGLGMLQNGKMNQRGENRLMMQDNTQDYSHFFQSIKGYGIYWDNYSPTQISDGAELALESQVGTKVDYYFMYGGDADGVIKEMRKLTGKVPMLPLWTYGFHQSRERYKTSAEFKEVVDTYRALRVPFDGIIQDWQYWGNNYLWNAMEFLNEGFTDYKQMIQHAHDANAHMSISIWASFGPYTKGYKDLEEKGLLYSFETWPRSGLPFWPPNMDYPSGVRCYDPFSKEARDIYWKHLSYLHGLGIDAWWMDSTDPDHHSFKDSDLDEVRPVTNPATGEDFLTSYRSVRNAFPLCTVEGVYNNQRQVDSSKRVFILTRSYFAGQQRTGANTWSGDVGSSWKDFRNQVPLCLNYTLTANPHVNTDLGGFFANSYNRRNADNSATRNPLYQELYVRWMQFGTFNPMMRSHGTEVIREIYHYGEPGDPVYDALLGAIKLRYEILPYVYSQSWQVSEHDDSFMRALMMDFKSDKNTWDNNREFMFGRAFLVAPVLEPLYTPERHEDGKLYREGYKADWSSEKHYDVYLPAGADWYDYWSGEQYAGGQTIAAAAPLSRMPLYVKAGSIVPLCKEDVQFAAVSDWKKLTLAVYPGANAEFCLYEDEGDNYNYEKGEYSTISLKWNDRSRTLSIGERKGSFAGMLSERTFVVTLPDGSSKTVEYNGKAIKVKF